MVIGGRGSQGMKGRVEWISEEGGNNDEIAESEVVSESSSILSVARDE